MIRVGVRGIPLYDHCQTEGIVHPNDPLEEKPGLPGILGHRPTEIS